MNWLYIKNNYNEEVFKIIASSKENNAYKKVLAISSSIPSSWDNLLFQWIEDIDNGIVSGVKINKIKNYDNSSIPLYPGALLVCDSADGLNIESDNSLLIKTKKNNNSLILLNSDTYTGNKPTSINIKLGYNNNSYILRSMKSSIQNDSYLNIISNTKPKYRNILLKD